jgi:predicted MPP superfamily phosphohydrolase
MSAARILVFAVVMLVLLSGVNVQVFRWARNAFGLGEVARKRLKAVLIVSVLGVVLGRVAGRFWPGPVTGGFVAAVSTLQLAVIISGILLLVADAARLLWRLPSRFLRRPPSTPAVALVPLPVVTPAPVAQAPVVVAAPPVEVPRRHFLTQAVAGSAFLIGGSSSLYGALKGRSDYVVEEVPLLVPGLSRRLSGFTIAQLSDVHIGVYVGDAQLAIAEELLRQTKPDLIVLTGDLLDNDPRLAPQLGRFVRRLAPLARHGVVAVSGNHDFFAGMDEVGSALRGGGAHLLRNEGILVGSGADSIALLGVDDVWARREGGGPDLSRALASLPPVEGRASRALDLPRVLLCHNPSFFAEAAGRVALQLSGHTHGGQVNLGVRPADYVLPGGWVAGRYDSSGSMLYVNRGFGTVGPPARIGARPEVTKLVLTA